MQHVQINVLMCFFLMAAFSWMVVLAHRIGCIFNGNAPRPTKWFVLFVIFDGQAWPFSVFTQKQVYGPRTATSQPIWIKFCTRLLLYGICLWADLDCDRHVGSSKPNQNIYVFYNTCNAP